MSISRRGLLAVGLTAAVVGSIGVASMINANADDGIDGGTPVAAVTSDAPADPGTIVRNDDGTEAIVPPSTTLPWGEQPTKMRVGRMGASAAELAATGAVAARDDSSRQPHPEFGPKGKFLRNNRVLTEQETTLVPGPVPPAPPAERGDPVIGSPKDVYYSYALARTPDPSQAKNPLKSVDGASANLVIGRPYLDKADWHTLSEIAVQSADGQQTIEVGWTVDRAVNGDEDPHLFVFSWVDGVPQCYNSCNYLPAKGASIKPGDTLAVNTVRNFGIQHIGNVWWVAIDSEWIGAFMDDTWGDKFTQAAKLQFYGEVAGSSLNPCSQMGSSLSADNAARPTAKFGSINFINPSPASATTVEVLSQPYIDNVAGDYVGWYPSVQLSPTVFRFGGNGVPTLHYKQCSGTPAPN